MIDYLKSFTQVCNSKEEKHSNSLQTFRLQFIFKETVKEARRLMDIPIL